MNKKIIGYAKDSNPKKLVNMVGEASSYDGYEFVFFDEDLPSKSVLLIGIGSQNNDHEAELIKTPGVKVVVLEDIHNAANRLPKDIWGSVNLLVRADDTSSLDITGVKSIIPSIPPHWKDDIEMFSKVEINTDLCTYDGQNIDEGNFIVMISGGKDPKENNIQLVNVVKELSGDEDVVIAMTVHPGETAWAKENDREVHISDRPRLGRVLSSEYKIGILDTTGLRTPDVAPSVDLFVHTGGSTMTIGASYAGRLGVFNYTKEGREDLVRLGNVGGTWYVPESGVIPSCGYKTNLSISQSIKAVRDNEDQYRRAMEIEFPMPKTLDTASLWWEAIKENIG
jgi:hypothetical protein